jgi:Rrf2 family protein
MLALTKKTHYALISLGYLAENPEKTVSAKQIAEVYDLPTSLVMNILKTLHRAGWLDSMRGTKGGYLLTTPLSKHTIFELIEILEGPIRLSDCTMDERCDHEICSVASKCPIRVPMRSLLRKLQGFLKAVTLDEILLTGRRHQRMSLS